MNASEGGRVRRYSTVGSGRLVRKVDDGTRRGRGWKTWLESMEELMRSSCDTSV